MAKKLKVLMASSEIMPFAKTGGLADVTGSLPLALEHLGHEVKLIMPYYQMVKKSKTKIEDTKIVVNIEIADKVIKAKILQTKVGKNVTVYFVDNENYYDRPELYKTSQGDYSDNAERFIFFSKAIVETLKQINYQPDIIHCNDWQTGLVPVLLKVNEKDNPFFSKTSTVFTIHNLNYQGLFWHLDMPLTNLPWDVFNPEGIEFYGKINLMKAGIVYSEVVNTVSKQYSKEILTPKFGCGLEGVLKNREDDLYGILNGVDYNEWSPEKDKYIKTKFSASDLSGKEACREDLLSAFGLKSQKNKPIISVISRLDDQKGFKLIAEQIDNIFKMDIYFILLGTGKSEYEKLFLDIAKKYPQKAGIKIGFDEALAHKIEAGSDFFLMPSDYEPCGLNQMYSMKYGTIPIVSSVGGLDDTVKNYSPKTGKGNGFKFKNYTSSAMLTKIKEAIEIYNSNKDFKKLLSNAMGEDFSWDKSAKEYEKLYIKYMAKLNK